MGSQVGWQAVSVMAVSIHHLETVWEAAEGDPVQVRGCTPPAAALCGDLQPSL